MNADHARQLAPYLDPKQVADASLYIERHDCAQEDFDLAMVRPEPAHCLLIGATGSGKSTELLRLARHASNYEDPPVVALVRLQDQCVPEQLSPPQVLFLLGVASLRLAAPDGRPDNTLVQSLRRAYQRIIEPSGAVDVDVAELLGNLAMAVGGKAAKLDPTVGIAIAAAGATGKSLRGVKKLSLPGRGASLGANDPAVTSLAEAVNDCVEAARKALQGAPLALFVDGLDKLEIDQVEPFFASGILAVPDCTVVYTAPLALRHGLEGQAADWWSKTLTLGNFRVFLPEPDGAHDPQGFEPMRKLLAVRIERAGLQPEQVFEDGLRPGGQADRLIEMSGGITRTFVHLCESALRRGLIGEARERACLGEAEVDRAIADAERRSVMRLRQEHIEPLRQCWSTQRRPSGEEGDRLLFYNLAHCYMNGFPWYRPTPLVLRYLAEIAAEPDAGRQ